MKISIALVSLLLISYLNFSDGSIPESDTESESDEDSSEILAKLTVTTCHVNKRESDIVTGIAFKCIGWNDRFADLLNRNDEVQCMDGNDYTILLKENITSIVFEQCNGAEFVGGTFLNISIAYHELTHLDISGIGLEKFDIFEIMPARNLEEFIANDNKLTEFPTIHLRVNSELEGLTRVELKGNKINEINPSGFAVMPYIKHLDLSNNNLTELSIQSFVKLDGLEYLDLSENKLKELKLGTFSFQSKLQKLSLAQNNLRSINFDMFLPSMPNLFSLYLDRNQLMHLDGFTNQLFPELRQLDIRNNAFTCPYLAKFLRSIDWRDMELIESAEYHTADETPNIRGVCCVKEENQHGPLTDTEPLTEPTTTQAPEPDFESDLAKLIMAGLTTFQSLMSLFIFVTVLIISCQVSRVKFCTTI